MSKTTVEHQNMGCRLCSTACQNGNQTAYLLCPNCQVLAKAAPDLLAALERIRQRAETDPTNLPVKMFAGEIVAMCTDAIYKAKEKP